jgi:hypothetical protein
VVGIDPEDVHDHMDAHYEVAHRPSLERLFDAGFLVHMGELVERELTE